MTGLTSLHLILFIIVYLCLHVSIPAVQTLVQVSVTTGGPGSAALQKVVLQLVLPEREILPGLSLTTYSQPGLTLQSSCHSWDRSEVSLRCAATCGGSRVGAG